MNTIRQYQVPLQKYMALTELQVVFLLPVLVLFKVEFGFTCAVGLVLCD